MPDSQPQGKPDSPRSNQRRSARGKQPSANVRGRSLERLGDILPQLMARTGFHRVHGVDQLRQTWQQLIGPALAQFTTTGTLKGGTLEIIVAHSTMMQEIGFRKTQLLAQLKAELPSQTIKDLRFRVGPIPANLTSDPPTNDSKIKPS